MWCRGINNRKKGPPCCRAAMWVRRGSLRTRGDWWGAPGRVPKHQPQRHTFTARLPAYSPPAPLQHHTAWRSLNDLHFTLVFLGLTNLQGLPREKLVGPSVGWFLCAVFFSSVLFLSLLYIWLSAVGFVNHLIVWYLGSVYSNPETSQVFFVSVSDMVLLHCVGEVKSKDP